VIEQNGQAMLKQDTIVIVHLVNPTEKFWGVLQGLDSKSSTLNQMSIWKLSLSSGNNDSIERDSY